MATILLSAVGAAAGAGFGGTVMGLSGAVIGRAVGATLGRAIDGRLLGQGSSAVEVGRVDRLRLTSAGEGKPIAQVWGRSRIGGQVIWASGFQEHSRRSGGGKGAGPRVTEYSYSTSLAIGLCEGEALRVGRIWADGTEIARESLDLRFYSGSEDQMPDPKLIAALGSDAAPAWRGLSYVVIEDLDLGPFGNRVPQFSFEVVCGAQEDRALADAVQAVALIPGTGEYTLATQPAHYNFGFGAGQVSNLHGPGSETDLSAALDQLVEELPRCEAVSLVVSWFGSDLRCGECLVQPKVEQASFEVATMPWRAGGIARSAAQVVAQLEGRPVYGGTPADISVMQAIAAAKGRGQAVMFYPFVLMEQLAGNGLADPWSGAQDQPVLPWRGRITLSVAPGREGSPDTTVQAEDEVARFFGQAKVSDFVRVAGRVVYTGPQDWGYRRFILHYAHLCALAGGVDAFCVGSELRGLTQIRGEGDSFPAVAALRLLVAEVRAILGPDCKLSYAADWSEYWGYKSPEGNRYFHLDPLWADPNVDFVGIDNYMPLSDWRPEEGHLDAHWGSIYNLDYLCANIAGGEGFDWFYENEAAAEAQVRTPITDGAYDEPWVWRVKDLRAWWSLPHHERKAGGRAVLPTAWVPGSKPIWFTEIGCAAVDMGTNAPNLFVDAKSSESFLPRGSVGRRDDLMQMQYLRALARYWGDQAHNPEAELYEGRMVEMSRAFVWAWDARPYPQFPARGDLWSDGENWARGHWISGRATHQLLSAVMGDLCREAGVTQVDLSEVYGVVRGFERPKGSSARGALQILMLAYGVDAYEREGRIVFRHRDAKVAARLSMQDLALHPEITGDWQLTRQGEGEALSRLRLSYLEAEGDFEGGVEEATLGEALGGEISENDLPLVMTRGEARALAERWLAESAIAVETVRLAVPPSACGIGAGDVVELADLGRFRIDRVEAMGGRLLEGVRVEGVPYQPSASAIEGARVKHHEAQGPLEAVFLDLPLWRDGEGAAQAPWLAVSGPVWRGAAGLWHSAKDSGYVLAQTLPEAAIIGRTLSPLAAAPAGLWDRGAPLRVRLIRGALASADPEDVLGGANLLAIGDGSAGGWEILQFQSARLVAPFEWEIEMRLRGLGGSEVEMPVVWPSGSVVVLLDEALQPVAQNTAWRGVERHYRVGEAALGHDHWAVRHMPQAFEGRGLRPLSPVHLRCVKAPEGDVLTWVRRTRQGGDDWLAEEVPLAEEREAYRLRILTGGVVRREVTVLQPRWTYGGAQKAQDGVLGSYSVEVAQVSQSYGAGPSCKLQVAN